MPNTRGMQILKIVDTIKKNKDITLENLIIELSTNEPYIKKTSALKLIDDLSKGINPKIKISDQGNVSCMQ